MHIIIGVIYIAFIMVTMYLVVRDRKCPKITKEVNIKGLDSSKDKKLAIIILLCTYFAYYFIGYLLKTDILNAFTFRKN